MAEDSIQLNGQNGTQHLINVVADRGDALSIKLKPCLISLNLDSSLFKKEYGLGQIKLFDAAINGGKYHPDVIFFFRGDQFYSCLVFNLFNPNLQDLVLEPQEGTERPNPDKIRDGWGGGAWPDEFSTGIDAALFSDSSAHQHWNGTACFFKGDKYILYKLANDTLNYPDPSFMLSGSFNGMGIWPSEFQENIDAVLHGMRSYFGKAWVFKGNQFIVWDVANMSLSNPTLLTADPSQGGWKNWPADFADGIDCAFYGSGAEAEKIYFFKGDRYFLYDLKTEDVVVPSRPILQKFPAFAQFIRKPQFFLVESYRLTTYYGDLTPENFSSGPQLSPGSEETYTVRIKRTTITDITQTKTVLESQDQRLVAGLNTSLQEDAASKTSTEQYDWKIDSSFHGDMSWGIGGGDINAQLSANGATNDVRKELSESTQKGIEQQVNNTYENHKQTVDSVSSDYKEEKQFESVWTRKVSNPTNRVISLAYAQLAQEYVTLVILEDIKLAFSNGEESEIVPLTKMDDLFAKYLDDSAQQAKAKTWVVNELKEVLDYQGMPCQVLKEISPQRYQFDPDLKSKFTLKNVDGTPRKEIVVDGLIIDHHRFKQLTDTIVLTEVGIQGS